MKGLPRFLTDTSIRHLVVLACSLWTLLAAGMATVVLWLANSEHIQVATATARSTFQHDLTYRLWAASMGGVYVPVTATLQPNPYLTNVAHRDVTTSAGQSLTLVNPAYMTRRAHEIGRTEFGFRSHITSLKPLRPENAPDPWEAEALRSFETNQTGAKEVTTVVAMDGVPHLRFMGPLVTRQACLKCHASQGHRIGDIRGGISVSVPIDRGMTARDENWLVAIVGLLWVFGMAGFVISGRGFSRRRMDRELDLAALRESEMRLQLALRAGGMGIWDWNVVSGAIRWSEGHEVLFGLEPGSFDGRDGSFEKIVHPNDRAAVALAISTARERREDLRIDFRILCSDGSQRWVRAQGHFSHDSTGNPVRLLGVVQDVTQERTAMDRLAVQALVLDQLNDLVTITDLEGRITYVNSEECRRMGRSPADLIGQSVKTFGEDPTQGATQQEIITRTLTDGSWQGEVLNQDATGRPFLVACRTMVVHDKQGRPVALCGIGTDITERARSEEALRESETRYRTLFDQATEGIALADADTGVLLDFNEAFLQLVDRDRASLLGIPQRTLHPDTPPEATVSESFVHHRDVFPGDIIRERILTGRGEIRDVEIKARVLHIAGRRIVQGFFRDVTDRRKSEEERERLNRELKRKNQELQNVLFAASHDLRSPLLNIQGFSRRLEQACSQIALHLDATSTPPLPEVVSTLLHKNIPSSLAFIQMSVQKMDTLIGGMLRLSRLGLIILRHETLDMTQLIQQILPTLALQIQECGATIEVGSLPACAGDGALLAQVFSNLLDNALKYRDPARPAVIRVSGVLEATHVVFCVADNGRGIPMGQQDRIWDLFARLHPETSQGEGLGLNLVRRIVERHEGRVWVESTPGEGSRFFVELPIHPLEPKR